MEHTNRGLTEVTTDTVIVIVSTGRTDKWGISRLLSIVQWIVGRLVCGLADRQSVVTADGQPGPAKHQYLTL